jgi:hypothetical protein
MLLYIILEWRYIEKDQKTIRYIVYIAAACIWCLTACSDLISELWLRWIDSSALILPLFFLLLFTIYIFLSSLPRTPQRCWSVCSSVYTHTVAEAIECWSLTCARYNRPSIIHNSINVHIALTLDSSPFLSLPNIYTESYLADLAAAASVCCASGTAVLSHLLFCPVLFDRPSFRYFYDFLLYRRVYKRYTLWAIVITRLNACVCVIRPLSPRSISLITLLGGSTKGPCWVGNSI